MSEKQNKFEFIFISVCSVPSTQPKLLFLTKSGLFLAIDTFFNDSATKKRLFLWNFV